MTDMCKHGYTFGMCPYGCRPTTGVIEPTIPEPMPLPSEWQGAGPYTDKLKCVICGTEVESGVVYKGKPVCNECMKGMKGEK